MLLSSCQRIGITLYNTIKNDKTHIYISKDGSHIYPPYDSLKVFLAFKEKYIIPHTHCTLEYSFRTISADKDLFAKTQPTVDQLREEIKPQGFFKRCINLYKKLVDFYTIAKFSTVRESVKLLLHQLL
ncbi:MAG TPA: hypothetical protein VGW78_04445 [Candidatus Babeliales bacterium]|jgi:hypothetical protein|nr:hypothetical protein [Candidatus Babeliales bacterium]